MGASTRAIELVNIAARASAEVKATSIVAVDVSERLGISDAFLIVSGSSEPQVRAIVDEIDRELGKAGYRELRREGLDSDPRWVVMDYGEMIVHVQREEDRDDYALAKLWGDGPRIPLDLEGYDEDGNALDKPEAAPELPWYQRFQSNGQRGNL